MPKEREIRFGSINYFEIKNEHSRMIESKRSKYSIQSYHKNETNHWETELVCVRSKNKKKTIEYGLVFLLMSQ